MRHSTLFVTIDHYAFGCADIYALNISPGDAFPLPFHPIPLTYYKFPYALPRLSFNTLHALST